MKRDMDFTRHILREIEAYPRYDESFKNISLDVHTQDELAYHVMLLHEAHLLRAIDLSTHEGPRDWRPLELTNEGHEFLEAARNETLWTKAKEAVRVGTGTLSLEALKLALKMLMEHGVKAALSKAV